MKRYVCDAARSSNDLRRPPRTLCHTDGPRPPVVLPWIIALAISLALSCKQSEPLPAPDKETKTEPRSAQDAPTGTEPNDPTSAPAVDATASAAPPVEGSELFARHCAACHGKRGDGQGLAVAFLFPKPRNLRAASFRLVSTDNNVPTREDLHAVLMRGMPGSSMPPWAHLSQQERDALVEEIMSIRREGLKESYIQRLKDDEGLTDDDIADESVQQEIDQYVDDFTTPGQSTPVPAVTSPTAGSLARGKEAYAKFACVSCHGETGRGDGVQEMFDEEQTLTSPRDFTLGIFKGNHDPASLYRRIAYGMPGTPMPSSSAMTPEQMMDLAHYILSLSTEAQRQAAIPERMTIVAKRVKALPSSGGDEHWANSEPVHLQMTPLWWRNDAPFGLTVQAVHDGTTIALRLAWNDSSAEYHASRTESFEDGVALELYRGAAEPFLGMGDQSSPVDVWFWDADRQTALAADDAQYPNKVVDVYPFSESAVDSAELNRPGARMADQPDISLPARATGNPIVPAGSDESGGTALHAAGPRTVTFRVAQSQIVHANGRWRDGRWAVVMTRPMQVSSPNDGVSLEPGARASVAFAVWDGSHRDRNGQKSVTIWQVLEIEK
jgi:DMSO reductase family type II enzyme heme b subunit